MNHPSSKDSPARPGRRRSTRAIAIGSGGLIAGAAVAFVFASQLSVQGVEPRANIPLPTIPIDTTSEDSPEKAAEAPVVPASIGSAHDQLTVDEVGYARSLAAGDDAYTGAIDLFGDPGAQYLSTNLSEPKAYGDGKRRFDLLYFDYGASELIRFVVNVSDGSVERVDTGSGSQPAPSDIETLTAFELLLESELSEPLKAEFAALAGESLDDPAQTEYSGHSHSATDATIGAESCGVERCVSLLAQAPNGTFLTTTPYVVNLSTKTVTVIK